MAFHRAIFICIFSFLLLWCCDKNAFQVDISEDVMVQLLVHTHINEAKLAHSYLPTDSAVLYFHLLQDSLYRYFRVDSARFHKALKQYSDHPDYFDKLYTRVVDSLAWREQRRYIRYK